jgi:hypothetical protein
MTSNRFVGNSKDVNILVQQTCNKPPHDSSATQGPALDFILKQHAHQSCSVTCSKIHPHPVVTHAPGAPQVAAGHLSVLQRVGSCTERNQHARAPPSPAVETSPAFFSRAGTRSSSSRSIPLPNEENISCGGHKAYVWLSCRADGPQSSSMHMAAPGAAVSTLGPHSSKQVQYHPAINAWVCVTCAWAGGPPARWSPGTGSWRSAT